MALTLTIDERQELERLALTLTTEERAELERRVRSLKSGPKMPAALD